VKTAWRSEGNSNCRATFQASQSKRIADSWAIVSYQRTLLQQNQPLLYAGARKVPARPPDGKWHPPRTARNPWTKNRLIPCRGRPIGLEPELKSERRKESPSQNFLPRESDKRLASHEWVRRGSKMLGQAAGRILRHRERYAHSGERRLHAAVPLHRSHQQTDVQARAVAVAADRSEHG
jgi:hypothetical protein